LPFPPEIIAMLFTENAANSSLRCRQEQVAEPAEGPSITQKVAGRAQSLPTNPGAA
jgi:hypothetical protein